MVPWALRVLVVPATRSVALKPSWLGSQSSAACSGLVSLGRLSLQVSTALSLMTLPVTGSLYRGLPVTGSTTRRFQEVVML